MTSDHSDRVITLSSSDIRAAGVLGPIFYVSTASNGLQASRSCLDGLLEGKNVGGAEELHSWEVC
jgi:hypothetical protein